MKNSLSGGNYRAGISLQQLISGLVSSSQPLAAKNKTSLVNEVGKELFLHPCTDVLRPVMDDLLSAIVANSKNGNIHISADKYRNVITLQIEERNNYNGYALAYSIMSIQQQAAMVGAHIVIKGPQQKIATVSFSFPNSEGNTEYEC